MREFSWFKLIFGLGLSALVGAAALLGFGRVTAAQGPGSPWRDLGGLVAPDAAPTGRRLALGVGSALDFLDRTQRLVRIAVGGCDLDSA